MTIMTSVEGAKYVQSSMPRDRVTGSKSILDRAKFAADFTRLVQINCFSHVSLSQLYKTWLKSTNKQYTTNNNNLL